jgi:hypothetical protein
MFSDGTDGTKELAALIAEDGEGSWERNPVPLGDGHVFVCFHRPGEPVTFSGDDVVVRPATPEESATLNAPPAP